jgi:hypothetical protein
VHGVCSTLGCKLGNWGSMVYARLLVSIDPWTPPWHLVADMLSGCSCDLALVCLDSRLYAKRYGLDGI